MAVGPSSSDQDQPLSASKPTATQIRIAAFVLALLLVALVATAPFARMPTRGTEVLLPAYAASIFVLEGITAALLLALFNVQRSRALLILASGYLFSAIMIPPWALAFPGVFAAFGVDGGLQTTAAIAAVRRLGFPLFVLGYGLTRRGDFVRMPAARAIGGSIAGVLALAGLATWLIFAREHALPAFMKDERNVSELWGYVPAAALILYAAGIAILLHRRRAALDIWVALVLFSLVIEILLISYLSGAVRLSVGWWAGRLYGLGSASIVLLVLLYETTAIYARLARSVAAERRGRQNRLTAMEALSASIAHEINQPLASMITNADAGLRWLAREAPRIDKADEALRRIVDDGHRANKIVTGIRTMFMKGAQERMPVDLNAVIRQTVAAMRNEAGMAGIAITTDLDPDLPTVIGNAVQLRQVVSNLIENAIDAINAAGNRQRSVHIRTHCRAYCEMEVTVEDTGTGLPREIEERIFDSFFSTKPGGMGMGLMFCRSIIEAHGGQLWTSPNVPCGAVFHFSLPGAMVAGTNAEAER